MNYLNKIKVETLTLNDRSGTQLNWAKALRVIAMTPTRQLELDSPTLLFNYNHIKNLKK